MSGYAQEKRFAVVAETRRKWSLADKRAVVAEAETASASSVARRHGISASLVFRWRRQLRDQTSASPAMGFVPLLLPQPAEAASAAIAPGGGVIEIVLAEGRRVRVDGSVDAQALKRVLAVLEGR
jgi:transposase